MNYVFKFAGHFPDGGLLVSGNGTKPPEAPFKVKIGEHAYTVTSTSVPPQSASGDVFQLKLEGVDSDGKANALGLSNKDEIPVISH